MKRLPDSQVATLVDKGETGLGLTAFFSATLQVMVALGVAYSNVKAFIY